MERPDERARSLFPLFSLAALALVAACVAQDPAPGETGSGGTQGSGTGGSSASGTGGGSGGSSASGTGGSSATGAGGTGGSATGAGGGGAGGTTGRGGAGGSAGTGGATGTGGAGGATPPPACGTAAINGNPFGCGFAWGRNTPSGALTSYSYLQFMSMWIGSEIRADGTLNGCAGCTWLQQRVSPTTLIPVFYGYIIGFYGHANGLPDGNVGGPPNLTTGGANLIRNNRAKIIAAYASYAQQARAVFSTRPVVWLLEGDMVQYSGTSQMNPLTYAELGQLTADITCAIKSNMANAVVAINHSTWNANDVSTRFWGAMAPVYYDLVWTSGAATTSGFFNNDTTATTYNAATATYAAIHRLTGKKIFVDTSFGASAMGDTWTTATPATVNARIADGVIAANVTTPPAAYQQEIAAFGTLAGTCN